MEAPYETLLVNRLAEITNNSVAQGAGSLAVVGAASNEDCRNGVPHIDKVSVELDTGHCRHMDISDQAGGFDETRGHEEIGGRRKSLDGVAQRPHEPSHGIAKGWIILNDRDQ